MKKMKGYKAGGSLLSKLPTEVRNKMGYMKMGGASEYGHGGSVTKFTRNSKRGGRCI